MRELALHILDLLQNSVEAGARRVGVVVHEDPDRDVLRIEVEDDGRGMDEETVRRVLDPFYTTRRTRPVGLGLPLLEAAARRCDGRVQIESALGVGTTVSAVFRHSSIDRAPLGDLPRTMAVFMAANPRLKLVYRHRIGSREFSFDTDDVGARLGEVGFNHPLVADWVEGYLSESLRNLGKG